MPRNSLVQSTDLFVLQATQDYLRSRLEHSNPDSLVASAWDEFYRVYSDLIRRYVRAHGLSRTDAEDCIQEVWREVATRLVKFERPPDRHGLRAWLYSIVRSKAVDLMRNRAKQPGSLSTADGTMETVDNKALDPASVVDRHWKRALVASLLEDMREQISPTSYRIIEMRFLESLGVKEIAAELNLTPEQVRSRQHRALKKMRTRIGLYTGEPFGPARKVTKEA